MKKKTVLLLLFCLLPASVLSDELTVRVQLADGSGPVTGAVVYVNDASRPPPVRAEVTQKDRMFHPHISILPTGSSVDFPNRDNTQHHVYSFSRAKTFDLELYAGRPEAPVVFDQPGIVELGCNIHDHMRAFIVVADTRAIGQTNEQGEVRLALDFGDSPAPGSLSLNIWHPRLPDNTRPLVREIDGASLAGAATEIISIELEPEPHHEGPLDHLQKRFREL
ncbi:methylamine utilization protein [Marinobacter sp. 1_MG-2023]|uniref:methylamine utilization protein n=1 Tax=Marinobacter sp. 1_MG-2023 TaxID=3062627 RepID=UPI0026E1182D|nr:methylamine utilization protein [Marinobacter sp. 1_MG-2023]MDO6824776.1 methylamine utilization protein [Marinobacter sp. 1_MG-2023]